MFDDVGGWRFFYLFLFITFFWFQHDFSVGLGAVLIVGLYIIRTSIGARAERRTGLYCWWTLIKLHSWGSLAQLFPNLVYKARETNLRTKKKDAILLFKRWAPRLYRLRLFFCLWAALFVDFIRSAIGSGKFFSLFVLCMADGVDEWIKDRTNWGPRNSEERARWIPFFKERRWAELVAMGWLA